MNRIEIGEYLVVDPEVCHGQLTFKGTRIPVETVLTFLSMGYTTLQMKLLTYCAKNFWKQCLKFV